MSEQSKSLVNQVNEITKLVDDVQERLDQVVRALATLQARLAEDVVESAAR